MAMSDSFVVRRASYARTPREVHTYAARRTHILRAAYDKGVGQRINYKPDKDKNRAFRNKHTRKDILLRSLTLSEPDNRGQKIVFRV